MKDRLEKEFSDVALEARAQGSGASNASNDAIEALVSLGYRPADAGRVVKSLDKELSSEDLIRQALRTLSGNVL